MRSRRWYFQDGADPIDLNQRWLLLPVVIKQITLMPPEILQTAASILQLILEGKKKDFKEASLSLKSSLTTFITEIRIRALQQRMNKPDPIPAIK